MISSRQERWLRRPVLRCWPPDKRSRPSLPRTSSCGRSTHHSAGAACPISVPVCTPTSASHRLHPLHAHGQQCVCRRRGLSRLYSDEHCELRTVHVTVTPAPSLYSRLPGIRSAGGSVITPAQHPLVQPSASAASSSSATIVCFRCCNSVQREVHAHIFHPQYCPM